MIATRLKGVGIIATRLKGGHREKKTVTQALSMRKYATCVLIELLPPTANQTPREDTIIIERR